MIDRTAFVVQLLDAWEPAPTSALGDEWVVVKRADEAREMLRIATRKRGRRRNKNGAHGRARRK